LALGSNSVPWKSSLVEPPARRKFTALVVRETLAAAGLEPAVCAGAGTAANPRIPVTIRQIVAFFTLVLLFAQAPTSSGSARVLLWSVPRFGPSSGSSGRASPGDAAQPIKCLRSFRLAEIAKPGTLGQDLFAQLING